MGDNSERLYSLAEDVKLRAHGRHPTAYHFFFFVIYVSFLFLFSFVTFVFCFLGTSVLEFKFGGECFELNLFQAVHPFPG
jgi:hypothetical protein